MLRSNQAFYAEVKGSGTRTGGCKHVAILAKATPHKLFSPVLSIKSGVWLGMDIEPLPSAADGDDVEVVSWLTAEEKELSASVERAVAAIEEAKAKTEEAEMTPTERFPSPKRGDGDRLV